VTEAGKVIRAVPFVDTNGDGVFQKVGLLRSVSNGGAGTAAGTTPVATVTWSLTDANFPATITGPTEFRIAFTDNGGRAATGSPAAAAYIDNIVLEDDVFDPDLKVSLASPHPDFAFGGFLELPAQATRTVRLENPAASIQSLTIESIALLDDDDEAFALMPGTSATPVVLAPGESIDVVVNFATSEAGVFTGQALVSTSVPERNVLLSLTAQASEVGRELLRNGHLEERPFLFGWQPRSGVLPVSGLAPGSMQAAAVRSPYGPFPGTGSDLTQGLQIPMAHFVASFYVAVPHVASPNPLDRNLHFWLENASASAPYINIAHLPAGNGSSEPGLHAYDGTNWVRIPGLPALLGSVDANADGDLGSPGDTRYVYFVQLIGRNMGTASAAYDVRVSHPNSRAIAATANDLALFGATPALATGVQNIRFVTSETLAPGSGTRYGFWVDDVSVTAGSAVADPKLTVASSLAFELISDGASMASKAVVLRNDGEAPLSITGLASDDPRFFFDPLPSLPFGLASGEVASLTLRFFPAGEFGPVAAEIQLSSNDSLTPVKLVIASGGLLDPDVSLIKNGDFEASLEHWLSLNGSVSAGLVGASTLAGVIPTGGRLLQHLDIAGPGTFYLDFLFASPGGSSNQRWFNATVRATREGGSEIVNLRYSGSAPGWLAYSGEPSGGTNAWRNLSTSLPVLAANTPYIVRLIGRGWGSPGAVYDLQVYSVDGFLLGEQRDINIYHQFSGEKAVARTVSFTQEFGGSGFMVDNVQLFAGSAPPVSVSSIAGLGFSARGENAFGISFTSLPIKTYRVEMSEDLVSWSNLATGLAPEGLRTFRSFTDPQAASAPKRFYRVAQE
jgi:hypothetical protein